MIKVLFVILFLLITLNARENPFFPSKGERDIPITSNEDRNLPALKRATVTLPAHARVLKKVTIEYKSLDGSISTQSIDLENSVDWHLPIFISQSYTQSEMIEKKVTKNKKFKKVASVKHASFYLSGKSLKIVTNDKIIRNFLLVQPHRIVVDFEKDTSMKSYVKKNKNSVFTKIKVGNHSGYYRAVIELDGYYTYKMKKVSDGYIFDLR